MLSGSTSPAPGFESPFELLSAFHAQLQRVLALLLRLVGHLHLQGNNSLARDAARQVLQHFDLEVPLHNEDEERHVFPALDASGDAALVEAAARLRQGHRDIEATWQLLEPLLRRVAEGRLVPLAEIAGATQRLSDLYEEHLELEDGLAYPRSRALIEQHGAQAVHAMGQEMAARRGLPPGTPLT